MGRYYIVHVPCTASTRVYAASAADAVRQVQESFEEDAGSGDDAGAALEVEFTPEDAEAEEDSYLG